MAEASAPDGTAVPDAGRVVGLLADAERRSVFAAVQLGAVTLEQVARAAAVPIDRAARALASLATGGIISQDADGRLVVAADVFAAAARAARARPPRSEHDGQPDEVRRVLDAFVHEGRLTRIPTARSKRLVVLDWLAQEFEPGVRYSEAMVNLVLGKRHPDTAALRRYLVDEGIMDRADGQYWRSGGTVPTGVGSEPPDPPDPLDEVPAAPDAP